MAPGVRQVPYDHLAVPGGFQRTLRHGVADHAIVGPEKHVAIVERDAGSAIVRPEPDPHVGPSIAGRVPERHHAAVGRIAAPTAVRGDEEVAVVPHHQVAGPGQPVGHDHRAEPVGQRDAAVVGVTGG